MTGAGESTLADVDCLQAFDALLPALAAALDVREVFERFSAVATRIVPHDEADLILATDGGTQHRVYASTAHGNTDSWSSDEHSLLQDPMVPRLIDIVPGLERGFRSAITAPLHIAGKVVGGLALFSDRAHAYSSDDLARVERLSAYLAVGLAHQRLADVGHFAELALKREASIEVSASLLRTISEVLDIRAVFPRVSDVAKRVVSHDLLTLMFHNHGGRFLIEAASTDEFKGLSRFTKADNSQPDEGSIIIDDFNTDASPIVEPADLRERIVAAGFRSLLIVLTRARQQDMGLGFWSKHAHAFSRDDIPIAQQIADHVALAVSHKQLAEAARQVTEAHARGERLEARVQSLTNELRSKTERVVGSSPQWRQVLKRAAQVAETETTVLISGESGTGKEVVARFVHRASARKRGPFVALNCAALPEQLVESELFGYERGAFTGAQQVKPGLVELASGGVLFLDEVSEMSPTTQAKFLRLLQEREFQRLGGTRPQKANVRVIAASNRDLGKAVERGDFREDLYYRLQVFDIHIAPLRERRDDILDLSGAFLEEIGRSFRRPPGGLTREAREALVRHDWPGNVRELRNALECAAILCEGGLINAEHLSLQPRARSVQPVTTDLNIVERDTIVRVMSDCRWNKSQAAKRLGLTRPQLYVRLRKYELADAPALA